MASVSFKNISKSYTSDESVIKGVDFKIEDGEFVVFVGPSGCGKSTLLRMVAGLEDITDGEIYIDDVLANDLHASKRGVAMVFQSYALYPHMTVQQNMGFALKMAGTPKSEIQERVGKAAAILQITHLLDRKPKALSGGQRQRVAIGRSIVRQPKVFLFDEPLSNLDASLRQNMRIELSRLHHELGTTMIYVTHDQVEAMTLADRIVVFNAGIIQQIGKPLDLYDNPSNLFVAGFLGAPRINLLQGRLINNHATEIALAGGQHLHAAVNSQGSSPGETVTLGIRPEHLQLAQPLDADAIEAKIVLVEHLGDQILVYLNVPGVAEELCMKVPGHTSKLQYGDTVHITLPVADCMLFDAAGLAYPRLH
ncbi:multiple sugar transport system ATP-binding protein [Oxalobacteraceae bacterium GrIS 2.11]